MYHISVNSAISRREKILGVQKDPGGAKKAIRPRGRQQIMSNFFRHSRFCWEGGQMVTLRYCC